MPVIPVTVSSDKYIRASAVSGVVEAGRCYLPRQTAWVYDFVEEHRQFPNGAYDDQVDTTSIALAYLALGQVTGGPVYSEPKQSLWRSGRGGRR
jgi:predicted phage terminase large subunit-like protein